MQYGVYLEFLQCLDVSPSYFNYIWESHICANQKEDAKRESDLSHIQSGGNV